MVVNSVGGNSGTRSDPCSMGRMDLERAAIPVVASQLIGVSKMAVKYRKQTGSFVAKDANGNRQTIYIYTDFVDAGTRGDPHAVIAGIKSLKTASGQSVNRNDQGKYQ